MGLLKSLLDKSQRLVIIGMGFVSILLSSLSLILRAIGITPGFHDRFPEVVLLLLSSFILFYVYREHLASEFMKWKVSGIDFIYKNRSERGQYDAYTQILDHLKDELFMVGLTLKNVARDQAHLLVNKANTGCSVDLLMLDPRCWTNSAREFESDLKVDFYRALNALRPLAAQIAQTGGPGRLEVRLYRETPTLCLTVVDGHSTRGKMRVELLPYNCSRYPQFQPIIDLRRVDDNDWFDDFYKHYRVLWDDAQVYIRTEGSTVQVDQEVDKEVSETLGLQRDWLPERQRASIEGLDLNSP